MKRTIELTPKSTNWMFIGIGMMNTGIGINLISQSDSWTHWSSILSLLLIIGGLMLMFYGIILFNPLFKHAPRIELSSQKIWIKSDIHKKEVSINWNDIQGITYKTLELVFLLKNKKTVTVELPTTTEKSIEVKKAIRDISKQKMIEIIGG